MGNFNQKIPVGDKGWVQLVDHMGSDQAIEAAARQSYGEGTRKKSDTATLLNYLMRHGHTTPFEMAELVFQVKVPMDTWRQWIRHRTASVNEYSTRYSVALEDVAVTKENEWRLQSSDSKQGSSGSLPPDHGRTLTYEEDKLHIHSKGVYSQRLKMGVAREQARKDLPLSNYTMATWKMDLHNLFHFLKLRLDPHAQQEIREFATAIAEITEYLFPLSYDAFRNYSLNAVTFSARELKLMAGTEIGGIWARDTIYQLTEETPIVKDSLPSKRERQELLAKLTKMDDGGSNE